MRVLPSLLLLLFLAAASSAEDHPFKTAKVGDWVQYKSEIKLTTGQSLVSEMKQTVVGRTAKEVAVKVEMRVQGRWLPGSTVKIDLDEDYNPTTMMSGTGVALPKAEILEQGEEKTTVAKKGLVCKWLKLKSVAEVSGKKVESITRIWLCPDVPVGGLVKMESETNKQQVVMEATAWGRGK